MTPLLLALHLALHVASHPLEPPHVRVEIGPDHLVLTTTHAKDAARPTLASPCPVEPLPGPSSPPAERLIQRERWACLPDSLTLIAAHRDPPVVIELVGPDQPSRIALLDATSPTLTLTTDASPFLSWLVIGAEHLIGGLDHVLLVVGLTLLIGVRRQLLFALTAFTLGHSISLALGATHLLTLPSALVETAIAATLVLLALDLVTRPHAHHSQTHSLYTRAPWLTGLAVGLIHGLGFAGVLLDLGLPDEHQALALIAFNLGLELAQLALVGVLAVLAFLTSRLPATSYPGRLPSLAGWVIGILGAAWVLERSLPL